MTPRGPAPRLKAAYACPVRFVAPTLNPTKQSSGARRPWVNCRPPAFAEEGSMKPMAGHPPAKAVGFGLAQTAGWALLFSSIIKEGSRAGCPPFYARFFRRVRRACRLKKQGCRGLSSPGAATGSIQCSLPLRAPYTTHACMLPASAQPEPPCVGIVHHTQTKTAPAKGCMARRGCAAAGHEKLRGSRAGHAPQRFRR